MNLIQMITILIYQYSELINKVNGFGGNLILNVSIFVIF